MPYCARLTYASTTTSSPATIREDLINILNEARSFNFNHQLHGVLYYGNNYFFQCIEGQKTQIDQLFERLKKDPRHKDIILLSYHEINQTSFKSWDMKYVHHHQGIQQFFSRHHWQKFNPYCLKEGLIDDFIDILIPHEPLEPSMLEQDELVARGQRGVFKVKYIVWLIFFGVLGLIVLYFLNMIPWQNRFGINFFNGP